MKNIISSTDMGMLCQRESQSEEHYKNLPLKERELIIGRLGYLLKLTSGNVEYSECLHEFLRGKVQKKALASRQAACKNMYIFFWDTMNGAKTSLFREAYKQKKQVSYHIINHMCTHFMETTLIVKW